MSELPMLKTREEIEARLTQLRQARSTLMTFLFGDTAGIDRAIEFYEWRLTNVDAVVPD